MLKGGLEVHSASKKNTHIQHSNFCFEYLERKKLQFSIQHTTYNPLTLSSGIYQENT
jgi:hypothetical protein